MDADTALKCVVVIGPTACGKTGLGVALARRFNGEIVSADSRQVYRGLDIGTGKDLEEYGTGTAAVSYHMIDVVDPGEDYHLFRYVREARAALRSIEGRRRLPIIVGGTSLYVNALLDDYALEGGAPDPELRAHLEGLSDAELTKTLGALAPDILARADLSQRRRLVRAVEIAVSRAASPADERFPLAPLILAPYYPRQKVHTLIEKRLDARLEAGMIEEVERLHSEGLSWERLDFFGLEYRYVSLFLRGEMSRGEMRNTLFARIRRFCKAQDAWFRKMEREGKVIYWLPKGDFGKATRLVQCFLAGEALPEPEFQLKDILYGPRSD